MLVALQVNAETLICLKKGSAWSGELQPCFICTHLVFYFCWFFQVTSLEEVFYFRWFFLVPSLETFLYTPWADLAIWRLYLMELTRHESSGRPGFRDPALQRHYGQALGWVLWGVLPGTLWCRTSWLAPLWLPHWGKGCWDGNRNIHSGFPSLACWNFVSSAFVKSKETTMTRDKKRGSQQTHIKRERRGSTFGRRHVFEWMRGDVF